MISRRLVHIGSCVALLGAAGCNTGAPIEPGNSTSTFAGKWVGVKRLVSCTPAGARCDFERLGEATYFSATVNQQGDAVDGSVILSEPGPLALPYGFAIKGQVSPAAQLTFERVFSQDAGEPLYSGDLSVHTSLTRRLLGRMTKQPSPSDSLTLMWEIEAVR